MERRGRPRKVTKKVVQAFENTRKKLVKKMKKKGGGGVPWKLIMSAGKLRGKVSIRRLQPVVKETEDVTYRPDRARPERTENETEAREHQSGPALRCVVFGISLGLLLLSASPPPAPAPVCK